MIVRLATGEEFEAKAEDFDKFGYAHTDTVITDWRKFIEAATGTDLLSAGSVLNPFWLALHQALNNPASLTDGSMGNTQSDIQELDRGLRESRAAREF